MRKTILGNQSSEYPLRSGLIFGTDTSSMGYLEYVGNSGCGGHPRVTRAAGAQSPRRVAVAYRPFILSCPVVVDALVFSIQSTDNTTMTGIKALQAKGAILSSHGLRYDTAKEETGMPNIKIATAPKRTLSAAAALHSSGTASGDRYSHFALPRADPIYLDSKVDGKIWTAIAVEVQYSGEAGLNNVWYTSFASFCEPTLFNPGSANEDGMLWSNLLTDIDAEIPDAATDPTILTSPSGLFTQTTSTIGNLGDGSAIATPQSHLFRTNVRLRHL
jgi:hypothetical protein